MAKKTARAARKNTSAPRTTTTRTDGTEYNPFLKAGDVPSATTLEMTGWTRRLRGKFGPQIALEVEDSDGKRYDFTFGIGSPNHRIMFDAFGNDETQWGTGTIVVNAKRGKNAPFVAILKAGNMRATETRNQSSEPEEDEDIPF